MATQEIKKIIGESFLTTRVVVDFDDEKDEYNIDWHTNAFREQNDSSEFIKIKNKVRAITNKAYKLNFNVKFTT